MWGASQIFVEWLFAITLAAGGAIMARLMLFWFDRKTGGSFKEWLANATTNDLAIYYGCRFIGVCLLFGLAIS